jgi:hypothetical protein
LLAGVPPIELHKVAFQEFLRRLREEDPQRPSTRIRAQDRATSTEVARKRRTEPVALARLIRGDLDSIALKALEKDRSRRYASPSDLAADIGRYLGSEAVLAMPPSVAYRARKFAGRHWAGLLAASLALVGICCGAGVAVYQARIAQQRFQQVRKLANVFLFEFHDEIANIPGTTKARAMLVKTALEYLSNLSKTAGADVELQAELAAPYRRVAEAQGLPNQPNIGDYNGAIASFRKSAELYGSIAARSIKYQQQLADTLRALAITHAYSNQTDDADRQIGKALAASKAFESDPGKDSLAMMADLYSSAGELKMRTGTAPTRPISTVSLYKPEKGGPKPTKREVPLLAPANWPWLISAWAGA